MSMHKKPLTPLEEEGLRKHGLAIGTPSQLSDVFRHGVAWALSQQAAQPVAWLQPATVDSHIIPGRFETCGPGDYAAFPVYRDAQPQQAAADPPAYQLGFADGAAQYAHKTRGQIREQAAQPVAHDMVDVRGVRSDGSTVLVGSVPMPPSMKMRELAQEQFGPLTEDGDGNDADCCLCALEMFHDWMKSQATAPAFVAAAQPQQATEPAPEVDAAIALLHRMLEAPTNWITPAWKDAIRPVLAGLITQGRSVDAQPQQATAGPVLTDDEIVSALKSCEQEDHAQAGWVWRQRVKWCRAIEAAVIAKLGGAA